MILVLIIVIPIVVVILIVILVIYLKKTGACREPLYTNYRPNFMYQRIQYPDPILVANTQSENKFVQDNKNGSPYVPTNTNSLQNDRLSLNNNNNNINKVNSTNDKNINNDNYNNMNNDNINNNVNNIKSENIIVNIDNNLKPENDINNNVNNDINNINRKIKILILK